MPYDAETIRRAGTTDPTEILRWQCLNGQCGVFAALLSAFTGWEIVSLVAIDRRGEEHGIHALVQPPDRRALIDAAGYHDDGADYLAEFIVGGAYDRPDFRFRVVPLAGSGRGYMFGWPHLTNATVPEVAGLVFKILTEIGYRIPPERALMSAETLAEALALAVSGCPLV